MKLGFKNRHVSALSNQLALLGTNKGVVKTQDFSEFKVEPFVHNKFVAGLCTKLKETPVFCQEFVPLAPRFIEAVMVAILGPKDDGVKVHDIEGMVLFFSVYVCMLDALGMQILNCIDTCLFACARIMLRSSTSAVGTALEHSPEIRTPNSFPLLACVRTAACLYIIDCIARPRQNVKDFAMCRTRGLRGHSLVFKKDETRCKL